MVTEGTCTHLNTCFGEGGKAHDQPSYVQTATERGSATADSSLSYASRAEAVKAGEDFLTDAYGGRFMRFMFGGSEMVVAAAVEGRYVYRIWPVTLGVGPDAGRGKFIPRKPGSLGVFKGTDALRAENRVVRDAAKAAGLNKDQARRLHDEVSGAGLHYRYTRYCSAHFTRRVG